ncbi:hypothetical protein LCGC14_0396860 [marine sediment metagenome]|uniref:Uncharacterized protein n=1 Tax=marine sediment metagenome TaxID=412755 RepID=A0A0F9T3Z0_9ZZZZ
MAGKGGIQYDLSLVRTDTTTEVGFMLDKDKNGRLRYERVTDPQLAQQFFTGSPDLGKMEPQKEISINQANFEAGFGQEFYSSAGVNEFRYYQSLGVDARFKNNLICGPKATAITLTDYSASITDGGLELWDDVNTLTNWPFASTFATLSREATTVRTGTYSAKISTQNDVNAYGEISQSLTWNNKYRDVEVKVSVYVYQKTTGATTVIKIYDGQGTTTGATIATTNSWAELTCTRTIDAAATELTIQIRTSYVSAAHIAYIDDITWSAPVHGNPVAFAEFNNVWYMAYGDVLVKLNGTGNGWTFVWSSGGTTITDLEPFVDDNLYVCLGSTAAKYYYMNTSESFTQSTLADGFAEYMADVRGTMHKVVLANEIKKATDPTNAGSWGTAITVGSTYTDITDIIAEQDIVYIGKEDMAYYLDTSDNDIALAEEIQAMAKSKNCKNMIAWHRSVYVPLGESSLGEYASDGTWTWRSPTRFSTNLANFSGNIQALTGDEEHLFAILDNSANLEILAGQIKTVEGTDTFVWHPFQEITLTGAEVAGVTSVYKRRLWIASTASSDSVYYLPLPTKYGDVTGDTDMEFQTGGTLATSWYHSNLRADPKSYWSMTVEGEGFDANNYITVDYQTYYTALTGTWTNLGNFTTSPSQTRYFPTTGVTGRMIRFRFTIVTNSTSTTPKMTNFNCRGVWRPTRRSLVMAVVKLGDNIPTKNGTQPSENYQSMKDCIVEAYDQVEHNKFYDIDSVNATGSRTVKWVNVLYAREIDLKFTQGKLKPDSKYELLLEEITTS